MFLSDRHGKVITIPSISIQYVIENVCLKRGEYLPQFSFYTRENELIFSFTQVHGRNNGCGPNLPKLLKLIGKDGKFYMYIPVYKELQITEREGERERDL